jgi:SEC-C motif domain protein
MRSRYGAYALGLADYIIDTTHPSNPHYNENHILWKKDLLFFSDNTQFDGLEILDQSTSGDNGIVTFRAILSSEGRDISRTERSTFVREKGKWFYLNGIAPD